MTLPPGQVPGAALTIRFPALPTFSTELLISQAVWTLSPSTLHVKGSPQGAPDPKGGPLVQLARRRAASSQLAAHNNSRSLQEPGVLVAGAFVVSAEQGLRTEAAPSRP